MKNITWTLTVEGFSWLLAPAAALKPVGSRPCSTPDATAAPPSCFHTCKQLSTGQISPGPSRLLHHRSCLQISSCSSRCFSCKSIEASQMSKAQAAAAAAAAAAAEGLHTLGLARSWHCPPPHCIMPSTIQGQAVKDAKLAAEALESKPAKFMAQYCCVI